MTLTIIAIVLTMAVAVLMMSVIDQMSKWMKRKSSKLPPGSVGWPLIGEGFSFMSPRLRPLATPGDFLEGHISRYGKIFTSNLFGKSVVISADADFHRFIVQNDIKLFKHGLPNHIKKLVGESNPSFTSGQEHKYKRTVLLKFFGRERLETTILRDADYIADALMSWENNSVISADEEAMKVVFNITAKQALGLLPGDLRMEKLRTHYDSLLKGFSCSPVNLPGTVYSNTLQAKSRISDLLREDINGRMRSKCVHGNEEGKDLLGWLVNNTTCSREDISTMVHGAIVAGYLTTPKIIALAIYLLGNCPKAIEHLREEHQQVIQMARKRGDNVLKWEDYKCMVFMQCVLTETIRLVGGGYSPRIAEEDIQFKGYVIPRGCTILNAFVMTSHLDPSIHKDPKSFNPWRWLGQSGEKMSQDFYAFGVGPRRCVGTDFARLECAIFLHHLLLKYDWKFTKPDHPFVTNRSFIEFLGGLPIKIEALPLSPCKGREGGDVKEP